MSSVPDPMPPDEPLGVVNLDKPLGWSSNKAVTHIRQILGKGGSRRSQPKVGHAGTLDPAATGVLVLMIGRAAKLSELVMDSGKQYAATVRLGASSTTDDAEGQIVDRPGAAPVAEADLRAALGRFVGEIQQRPPNFSAIHVEGQRAYDIARKGEEVDLPARPVTVHAIRLVRYEWPTVELEVDCGRGVYIRSIARDLGEALGVGGYLTALRRTRVGPFTIQNAVRIEDCREDNVADWLRPVEQAVADLPRIQLSQDQANDFAMGIRLTPDGKKLIAPPGPSAVVDPAGRLLAIGKLIEGLLAPVQVLRPLDHKPKP